jgi:hypothetical protein
MNQIEIKMFLLLLMGFCILLDQIICTEFKQSKLMGIGFD